MNKSVKPLRKPYQYLMPVSKAQRMVAELKMELRKESRLTMQYAHVDLKPVLRGTRLSVWALSHHPYPLSQVGPVLIRAQYHPAAISSSTSGVGRKEWKAFTTKLTSILGKYLGKRVKVYVEKWSTVSKFQYRFDTYIMYKELAAL